MKATQKQKGKKNKQKGKYVDAVYSLS